MKSVGDNLSFMYFQGYCRIFICFKGFVCMGVMVVLGIIFLVCIKLMDLIGIDGFFLENYKYVVGSFVQLFRNFNVVII